MQNDWSRRSAMLKLASLAIGAAAAAMPAGRAKSDFDMELRPPLRSLARASGIKFGCAEAAPGERQDGVLFEKLATEADIFTPEWGMKWFKTEPHPGVFDFSDCDGIAAFAARYDMLVHGHPLVWYFALPPWVLEIASARDAEMALERHITTLVSRYRGRIWAWDVVNEPIETQDDLENGYRNSIWMRRLGIGYIDRAFRLAHAADPTTPLSLNEYGLEYATGYCALRRQATLALLQKLRDDNAPIDCFGLQSHLLADRTFDRNGLTEFLRSVVKLGYRLMITELDVNDVKLRGRATERDIAVARHVAEYLDIVFSVARPISITTWGLSDRYTWLSEQSRRADGSAVRPLPLDADFNRKPMWATLARYLAA